MPPAAVGSDLAKSLEEALLILRKENITLVVTERTLEGQGDGFQLLRAIKGDPELSATSVVFHAPANVETIKQAREMGAEDWFQKPHSVEIMAIKLGHIISRRHADPGGGDGVHGTVRDMGVMELVQISPWPTAPSKSWLNKAN